MKKELIILVLLLIFLLGCAKLSEKKEAVEKKFKEECNLIPDLKCTSFKADSTDNAIKLTVKNYLGYDIREISLGVCGNTDAGGIIKDRETTFTISPCYPALMAKTQFEGDINVTYKNMEGVYNTGTGQLITKIE